MSADDRRVYSNLIEETVESGATKIKVCEMLGVSLRTIERWKHNPEDGRKGPKTKPSHSLSQEERAKLLDIANSVEFASLSPWKIVAQLADRGEYIASESSFYRILKEANLLGHRLKSQPRQNKCPEVLTTMNPNEIWSWDITYLKAEVKGKFYYLYLPMDVFSRFIVHWEVHDSENAYLAAHMIERACEKEGICFNQLKLHSDNGGPMKGATMLATLQRLGVIPSFSRPKVSDDNPYSESLFKTLKYCPSYPERGFASLDEAKKWVEKFVYWYNNIHLHSGIKWVTPAQRHYKMDQEILIKRHEVYQKAREKNPHRWSKQTRNWNRVTIVELNPGRRKKERKDNQIRTEQLKAS